MAASASAPGAPGGCAMKLDRMRVLCCAAVGMAAVLFSATPGLAVDLPVVVGVSVPPQAFLVERIGGDRVEVHVLVPPGASPATYEPSPQQVVALSRSSLYVKVGHPNFLFEQRHLESLVKSKTKIGVVDMSAGTQPTCPADPDREAEEDDPHIWLSPSRMRSAASVIAAALTRLDPEGASLYRQNLQNLISEIDRLDHEIGELMAGKRGRRFMVFHPAWGHFACEYGLHQMAIEAGGKEPGPAQLVKIIETARDVGIKVVFVQEGFSDRSARVIAAELGAKVEPLDPLAHDWLENLRFSARKISAALR